MAVIQKIGFVSDKIDKISFKMGSYLTVLPLYAISDIP